MPELGTSGSDGGLGRQLPRSTHLAGAIDRMAHACEVELVATEWIQVPDAGSGTADQVRLPNRDICFGVTAILRPRRSERFPDRCDAGAFGLPDRGPLRHVCGGELLPLDPGGFDDPGSAFALAEHKPREVGLRHAHRFATVFHERGAHAGI